jgi:putative ABC transport system permease protein
VKALNRKVLRDLGLMRGQVVAIAIVITSGMAAFVMFIGAMESLTLTRDRFYREYAFADVFASLKRAPDSLRGRIAAIPGVSVVETRVVAPSSWTSRVSPSP